MNLLGIMGDDEFLALLINQILHLINHSNTATWVSPANLAIKLHY